MIEILKIIKFNLKKRLRFFLNLNSQFGKDVRAVIKNKGLALRNLKKPFKNLI